LENLVFNSAKEGKLAKVPKVCFPSWLIIG
jgi:hypothetical protein